MTERTTVTENVAKKLCFAGEESGMGFVVSSKKHVENPWLCRLCMVGSDFFVGESNGLWYHKYAQINFQ